MTRENIHTYIYMYALLPVVHMVMYAYVFLTTFYMYVPSSHYCRCCCNPGKCSGSKQYFFCSSPTPLLLSLLEAIPARHKHASKHSTSLWPRYLFVQLRRHRPISHFGSRSSPNVDASSNIFLDLHDGGFVNIVQSIGLSVSD